MVAVEKATTKKKGRLVIIVTGMSGSGKQSVMRTLEDLGFYCVDNLPLPLLTQFLEYSFHIQGRFAKVAIGMDVRGKTFLNNFIAEIERAKVIPGQETTIKIIFLNSSDSTIVKRFQETRRRHPLARGISLAQAISAERLLLEPIKKLANVVHDTDRSNIHELRNWVRTVFSSEYKQQLVVGLVSFGFKYGVPEESNLVYDVRFLPNPYFVPELRLFDGRNERVFKYLFEKEEVLEYWKKLEEFLRYVLGKYYEEGRYFVTIAIGCTGGKHRSVAFVEKIKRQKWENVVFLANHRDVGKE